MRISDWSSDVCSSDLSGFARRPEAGFRREAFAELPPCTAVLCNPWRSNTRSLAPRVETRPRRARSSLCPGCLVTTKDQDTDRVWGMRQGAKAYLTKPFSESELAEAIVRSEEHTSELQSLMRISYAV